MDEKLFAADGFLFQYTNPHQFFEIPRGRLANGDLPLGQVLNATVWQLKWLRRLAILTRETETDGQWSL